MSVIDIDIITAISCPSSQEFQREAKSHVALYEQVKTESEQWEEYLIPEERLADLPSEESTPSSPNSQYTPSKLLSILPVNYSVYFQ